MSNSSIALPIEQGTPDWHAWRTKGIGASEVYVLAQHAAALGFEPPCPVELGAAPGWLKTPRTLYREKAGLQAPEDISGEPQIERGNRVEPPVRTAFNVRFNADFAPACVSWGEDDPRRVSLDGLAVRAQTPRILEVKAPGKRWNAVPEYVRVQCAYQAAVVARKAKASPRVGVAVGFETDEGEYKDETGEVSYDVFALPAASKQAFGHWLTELVGHFWTTFVEAGVEPPMVSGDELVREDAAFVSLAESWAAADQAAKEAKAKADAARKALLDAAGSDFAGSQVVPGVARVARFFQAGSIDANQALAELAPGADLEPYRKAGAWRTRLTGDKG